MSAESLLLKVSKVISWRNKVWQKNSLSVKHFNLPWLINQQPQTHWGHLLFPAALSLFLRVFMTGKAQGHPKDSDLHGMKCGECMGKRFLKWPPIIWLWNMIPFHSDKLEHELVGCVGKPHVLRWWWFDLWWFFSMLEVRGSKIWQRLETSWLVTRVPPFPFFGG